MASRPSAKRSSAKRSAFAPLRRQLCPAARTLDEACFQATPVPFASTTSTLRWGGIGGRAHRFAATDVSDGTLPVGSTWRKDPLPRGPWDWLMYGPSPLPVCDEPAACRQATHHPAPPGHSSQEGAFPCTCSGSGVGDLYTLEVVDELRLPADLAPGEWVLGWRWDVGSTRTRTVVPSSLC